MSGEKQCEYSFSPGHSLSNVRPRLSPQSLVAMTKKAAQNSESCVVRPRPPAPICTRISVNSAYQHAVRLAGVVLSAMMCQASLFATYFNYYRDRGDHVGRCFFCLRQYRACLAPSLSNDVWYPHRSQRRCHKQIKACCNHRTGPAKLCSPHETEAETEMAEHS